MAAGSSCVTFRGHPQRIECCLQLAPEQPPSGCQEDSSPEALRSRLP